MNRLIVACVAAMLPLSSLTAFAGEGAAVKLPKFGAPKNGLRLTVNTVWVESPGYRPVHLTVETSNGLPSKEDRRLDVRIMPYSNWGFERYISGEIVLPQGEVSSTGHLFVPQSNEWYNIHIQTSENGRVLKDLSVQYEPVNRNNPGFDTSKPKMLVIDTNALTFAARDAKQTAHQSRLNSGQPALPGTYNFPDVRGLLRWNPGNNYPSIQGVVDDISLVNVIDQSANIEVLPPEQLPEEWIGFSSVDLIFVSLPDAIQIRTKRPRLSAALKEWVGTGGNLIVYGVEHDYSKLNQLDAVLGVQARGKAPLERWEPGGSSTTERRPDQLKSLVGNEVAAIRGHARNHPDKEIQQSLTDSADEYSRAMSDLEWVPMRVLKVGHGKVIAMPEKEPFPGSHGKWDFLDKTIKPYSNWNARVGVDVQNGDGDFLKYMIPGVGLPPVHTFRLLITLFVIVIGPVNYLLLKRRKRLFLLLVTVPLGAGIVTMSLFGYAIIKDGLSVQARVHSYTNLDQRAGVASSWSRQTYFASLPPSQGLVFPESATVHMIFDSDYQTRRAQEAVSRTMIWEGASQRLRRGYLGSRTTTEFLVANSQPIGEANLIFSRQSGGEPPTIENQLGAKVEKLLFVAEDGTTYWAADIEPGASGVVAKPRASNDAMQIFQTVARENRPVDPGIARGESFFFGGYRRYVNQGTVTGQGLLGHGRYRTINANPASPDALQPGEFLAIVERSPFVPLGVEVSDEEASFHVIRGRYVAK